MQPLEGGGPEDRSFSFLFSKSKKDCEIPGTELAVSFGFFRKHARNLLGQAAQGNFLDWPFLCV